MPWLAARATPPGGQPGALESLLVGPAALPGGLRAAANLGAVAPSPPRRARCAHGAAHRCATSRGFSLLTAPPNYGKLIVGRRGGHHCPHYREKSSEPRERSAALFFTPAVGKLRPRGGALRRRRTPPPEPPPALALWRLGAEGEKVVPRPRVGHRPTTRPGGLPHQTRLAGSKCSPARRSAAKCSRRALRGSGAGACAARQKGKAKPFGRCAALPFLRRGCAQVFPRVGARGQKSAP